VIKIKWGLAAAATALIISFLLGMISGVGASLLVIRAIIFMLVFFGMGFGLRLVIERFFPDIFYAESEPDSMDSFDQQPQRVNIVIDNAGEYAVPELYKTPSDPNELGNIEDLISGTFKPYPTAESSPAAGIDRKDNRSYNDSGRKQSMPGPAPVSEPAKSGLDIWGGTQDIFNIQDTSFFDEPELPEDRPQAVEKPAVDKPSFTPSFGGDSSDLGGLPDLDIMAMAFSSGGYSSTPASSTVSMPAAAPAPASAPAFFEEAEPVRARHVSSKPTPLPGDFNPKELAEGIRTVLSKEK